MVTGALSVLIGVCPAVGVLAIGTFVLPITVITHDFWTMGRQSRQIERIHFLKNAGLIGAALVFPALPTTAWPLAVGVGHTTFDRNTAPGTDGVANGCCHFVARSEAGELPVYYLPSRT